MEIGLLLEIVYGSITLISKDIKTINEVIHGIIFGKNLFFQI